RPSIRVPPITWGAPRWPPTPPSRSAASPQSRDALDSRAVMMHGVAMAGARYTLKADPHSSHSVMLRWLGDGRGRRLLDVGAADGLLSRELSARGWRVTGIEAYAERATAGAGTCEPMLVADLDREAPALHGLFDAIVYGDVLGHLRDPARVLAEL